MRKKAFGKLGRLALALAALAAPLAHPVGALVPEAAASAEPYRVGGNVSRPEKISGNPPLYTEIARKARLQGVVIVEAVIDENGDVTDARVLKGLPMGLDRSALEAVSSWKFKPATLDGKPVSVFYVLTINFQIDSGSIGPAFGKLLSSHPDLSAAYREARFADAAAVLENLVPQLSEAEVVLVRVHLLVGESRFEEAWQLAQRERSPALSPVQEEIDLAIAEAVLQRLNRNPDKGAALLETALEATAEALAASPASFKARSVRSGLLRIKSRTVADEAEQQEIAAEIERLDEEMKRMTEERTAASPPPVHDPASIRRVGGAVTAPEKISGDPHEYTEMARKARLQGVVILELVVSETGEVETARILKGLPMGLSEQALAAAKTYRFRPALENGRPVRAYFTLTLNFQLI